MYQSPSPLCLAVRATFLTALLAAGGISQTLQTYVAYPSDGTLPTSANNAPLGRNGSGATDEARAQIVIPAAFLPPTDGVVIAIKAAPNANSTMTYASLDIQAANIPNTAPFPTLNPVFATNLGAAPVTVFSQLNHTITWPAQTWTRITFSTPFVYLPGQHLLLDFQKAVACPASQGLGHFNARVERTPPGSTFDLPIMMVSFGTCGSNAHMATANTSNGGRRPPRIRVVFLDVPTLVANSSAAPNVYWTVGNSFTLTTHAHIGSWAVQLIDLVGRV